MIRFYLKNKEIKNKTVVFDEEQSKQLRKVLRMKPGDKVIVFDNKGWEFEVELEKITNDFSLGKITSQELFEKTSNITLYQALPKNLKVEFIIQKCTELGVDKIIFFESDYSQVKANLINDQKLKRWKKIAIEAAEQSGRVFLPEIILENRKLEEILQDLDPKNTFFLDVAGKRINTKSVIDIRDLNFFVGPEGGFSLEEVEFLFKKNGFGGVRIAENILRSETAGMTFLAQVQVFQLSV